MKKYLYFLVPIALWGLCGVIWPFSAQFMIGDDVTALGMWWLITDFAILISVPISIGWAIKKLDMSD